MNKLFKLIEIIKAAFKDIPRQHCLSRHKKHHQVVRDTAYQKEKKCSKCGRFWSKMYFYGNNKPKGVYTYD